MTTYTIGKDNKNIVKLPVNQIVIEKKIKQETLRSIFFVETSEANVLHFNPSFASLLTDYCYIFIIHNIFVMLAMLKFFSLRILPIIGKMIKVGNFLYKAGEISKYYT